MVINMIKVSRLTKIYGDRIAVNDISFELGEHKVIGFLGPNGAGKSTTMNMITGYIAPNSGSVVVDEISMMKFPQKAKKKIGYLPEMPPLYLDMTVEEYIAFVAELKQIPKNERAKEVDRVIGLAKIEGVRARIIRNLSKGYRQRVGIAQALVSDPDILILDEPTVGLDPKQIVEIRNLIRELGKNHTVILSTHILSEVEAVCDEIIIISRGKIVAQDSSENLVRLYNVNQEITLVLKTNATTAEKIMDMIPEISEYKLISEEKGLCKLKLTIDEKVDVREKIATICQKQGVMILELGIHEASLEEVYLSLTNDTYLDTIFVDADDDDFEDEVDEEEE